MYSVQLAVYNVLKVVQMLIFLRAILSWFIKDPQNPIYMLIGSLTEPILSPIRNFLFKLGLSRTLDLSPIVAYFLAQLIGNFVLTL